MTDSRRLSLPPKSILKQKFKDDDTTSTSQNLSMSQIQFPTQGMLKEEILDGNNTTSRISTSMLKGDRRVSFAPDVTLHKFEFIPQTMQNVREPRRKSSLKVELTVPPSAETSSKEDVDNSGETMECTSPVGPIFQQPASPKAPQNDEYQPIFDKEVSMDITQLFAKYSAKPDDNEGLLEAVTSAQEYERADEDLGVEETMDFTAPQRQRSHEEESMEITEQIRVEVVKPAGETGVKATTKVQEIPAVAEETLELANVQAPLEIRSSQVVSSTQLEPAQLPPSKRRKLSNGSYQSPIKGQGQDQVQVHGTPEQKENIDEQLTDMERLSPIPLATNSTVLPVTSLNVSSKKDENYDTQIDKQSQSHPVSLQTFFDAACVKFNVDGDIEQFNLEFRSTQSIEDVPSNVLYQVLYCTIPLLEIQAFTAKELNRRIIQSRSLLKSLQEQIASNAPPRLIKEYFDADEDTRLAINKKLELVTFMARLQSEKVWFEWRSQHLKGIKTVLEENMAILLDENARIMKYMNEINDVKMRVSDIKQVLLKELDVLRQHKDVFGNRNENVTTLLKVNKLKEDLKNNMLKVSDLSQLRTKKDTITEQIQEAKLQMNKVNQDIIQLQQNLKQSKICTEYDVEKLRLTHGYYQNISGVKFKKLVGPLLSVSLHNDKIGVTVDLSKNDHPSCISFDVTDQRIEKFEREFIICWIESCQQNFTSGTYCITFLQRQLIGLSIVTSEFQRLKLAFPTTVESSTHDSQTKLVTFRHVDYKYHCKVSLSLSMEMFINLICNSSNATIVVNVIYGEEKTAKNLVSNLIKKYEKVFRWLSNCNVSL